MIKIHTQVISRDGVLSFQYYKNLEDGFFFGIIPKNQFYGVVYNLRDVGYIGDVGNISLDNQKEVFQFFSSFDLSYEVYENEFGGKTLLYGKNSDKFKKWHEVDVVDDRGILLGYPKCCISKQFFEVDLLQIPGYFLNNNIFSLHSFDRELSYMNLNVYSHSFTFLFHSPCNYNCKASLKNALKLRKILDFQDSHFCSKILEKTYKDYLFFDRNNWFAFDFSLNIGDTIFIESIFEGNIDNVKLIEYIKKSTKFTIYEDKIDFYSQDGFNLSSPYSLLKYCIINFRKKYDRSFSTYK